MNKFLMLLFCFIAATPVYAQMAGSGQSDKLPQGIFFYKNENRAKIMKGLKLQKEKDGSYSVYNPVARKKTGTIECNCRDINSDGSCLLKIGEGEDGSKYITCISNGCKCNMSVVLTTPQEKRIQ